MIVVVVVVVVVVVFFQWLGQSVVVRTVSSGFERVMGVELDSFLYCFIIIVVHNFDC
jgi:hypothetical protein